MKNLLSFRRKLLPLLLFSISLSFTINAQSLHWLRSVGGTGIEEPAAIAHDAAGNIYTVGLFDGTADFDPGAGTFNMTPLGNEDGFICKLDGSGNFVWAVQIGGVDYDYISNVQADASGNILITGNFMGTVDFDPGAGVYNMTSSAGGDQYLLKLDAAGNFLWAEKAPSFIAKATQDLSGNIYLSGAFGGTVDFDPGAGVYNLTATGFNIYVQKLNATGGFVWAKAMTGIATAIATSLDVDKWGNVYATGIFDSTIDFNPGPAVLNLTAHGQPYDIFLLKLNASGDLNWARAMGSMNFDIAYDITLDTAGSPIITGTFTDTMDFDPGAGVYNLIPPSNATSFLARYDTAGNFSWAKGVEAVISRIKTDTTGSLYVAGGFNDTTDLDPGPAVYRLISAGDADMFVAAYNTTNGAFIWVNQGFGSDYDAGDAIDAKGGNVYVAGEFYSPALSCPPFGVLNSPGINKDVFVMKFGECTTAPAQISAIVGPSSVCSNLTSVTYSVPVVSGATSYTWTLPAGWTGNSTTNVITLTPGATGGTLSVVAVNSCGTSISQSIALTLSPPPTVALTAADTSFCLGDSTLLQTPSVAGYTYQWRQNGLPLAGATNNSYYALASGAYTVDVTAGCTVTATPISVTATVAQPTIQQTVDTVEVTSAFTTYQWYLNSTPIAGATNQKYVATQSGGYFAVVTNSDGCTGMSNSVSIIVSGVEDIKTQQGFNVSPNPSKGTINISSNQTMDKIIVTDVMGRSVYSSAPNKTNTTVNIAAPDMYFITVISGEQRMTKKVVVER